jgi:polar amino acid transport system substrate-binding protein
VVRDQVVITVVDEGVGIPAEHMRRLGEPFFTTKRERGGTGLGLSVVRRILDAHGGELHMTSTPDAGTTVAVHLPIQRRDHG